MSEREVPTLQSFLNELVKESKHISPIRVPRKESIKAISRLSKLRDARIVFEEFEGQLRKPRLIGDWAAVYSVYADAIVLEYVPDWSQIERAVDIRGAGLLKELYETVSSLSPTQFAYFLSQLFSQVTWAAEVRVENRISRDGGVDFEGHYVYQDQERTPMFGQAKHWKGKVGSEGIRTFIGSVLTRVKGRACVGVYVCTGGFTADALETIRNSPFKLLRYDLQGLTRLMIDANVGVRPVHLEGAKLDRSFWDEISP